MSLDVNKKTQHQTNKWLLTKSKYVLLQNFYLSTWLPNFAIFTECGSFQDIIIVLLLLKLSTKCIVLECLERRAFIEMI